MKIALTPKIHQINTIFKYNKKNNINSDYCDTFVKTTSFGAEDSKSYAEFEKWARQCDFKTNAKSILKNPNNYVGKDKDGDVFFIPNCENWVIKRHYKTGLQPQHMKETQFSEVTDNTPELNIGQKIASLWVPMSENVTTHYYVHKKIQGGTLGVRKFQLKSISASTAKTHIESLCSLANLEQEKYDIFIKNINLISKNGHSIDASQPNNFSISNTNEINFVVNENSNKNKQGQFAEALYGLLGGDYSERFLNSHRPDEEKNLAKQFTKNIIKKFCIAMDSQGIKFSNTEHFPIVADSIALNILSHSKN